MNTSNLIAALVILISAVGEAHGRDAGPDSWPLSFVENQGQWEVPARFVARRGPMIARLEPDGIAIRLSEATGLGEHGVVVRLTFEGGRGDVSLHGERRQRARHNYYVGADRSRWRAGVPSYASVLYRGLYDGVDLRVRDHDGRLEYDLLVAPGADPGQVVVCCEGVDRLQIDDQGTLVMSTALGPITQAPPVTWYELPDGSRQPVACTYCLIDETTYGFEVPGLDSALPLVIDPGLEWSTFLGGSANDGLQKVHVGPLGVTVAGLVYPTSGDFPTSDGAYDMDPDEIFGDAYVARLSADGSELIWSTLLGGETGLDAALDMVVDEAGVVTVVGRTFSNDFPMVNAHDSSFGGTADAFVARLDPSIDGVGQLVWSTYLGGPFEDRAGAVDLVDGDVVVAGYTQSESFPTTPGVLSPDYNGGTADAFVVRLDPDALEPGAQLVWSTFLGGSAEEGCCAGTNVPPNWDIIDVDVREGTGDIFLALYTESADCPMSALDDFDQTYNGFRDAYLAMLSPDGTTLGWSTYLGGSSEDSLAEIHVDDTTGLVTVAGFSMSNDFPVTDGAYDMTLNNAVGEADVALARFDPSLAGVGQLLYGTYLGGPQRDVATNLAVDDSGTVTLTGFAGPGFPTTANAYDQTFNGGGHDSFVARLRPDGAGIDDLLYATYLGGSGSPDQAQDLALVGGQDVVVAGVTNASDFPVTPGAYDATHGGGPGIGIDAFIARLDLCPPDLDDDGTVSVTDLVGVILAWGDCPGCLEDVNGDGAVDVQDLVEVVLRWGPCWP